MSEERRRAPGRTLLVVLGCAVAVGLAAAVLALAVVPDRGDDASRPPALTAPADGYGEAPDPPGADRPGDQPWWWTLAGLTALVVVVGRTLRVALHRHDDGPPGTGGP